MYLAGPPSSDFEPSAIVAPERFGAVAWSDFNRAYARLQTTPWRLINRGRPYGALRRGLRLLIAYLTERNDAFVDLASKAEALAGLPIPRDPDIVYYGAEVGWEAYLLRALFGDKGRLVLIDADGAAHERFLAAERQRRVRTSRGELLVERDVERTEYVRDDFFRYEPGQHFDVGLDWGLLEHFHDADKARVLARFRENLRPSGVQISAVPRDTWAMRLFYWAFSDELNFGRRELLRMSELSSLLTRAGFSLAAHTITPSTCIAVGRRS
jgi:hypothetical protein